VADDYPRFLCRPGTSEDAWGYRIDTGSAVSEEDEKSKLAAGWYRLPGEWDRPAETRLPQLDHDHKDGPGGSEAQPITEQLTALRAEYKAKTGKKAWHGWDEAELRRRIDEHGGA
jgi:hypothetical protein